jgi:tartronate-semialdehyde synthase
MQRKTHFDQVPVKPQRVYEEMNAAFGRDTVYVSTIGLSQIAGAQFRLPYVQVLVNNSYLGLIRQAQRGFEMDYCVQLAFENQNVDDADLKGYGVDHQAVVEGLGCKALRVTDPAKIQDALQEAQRMAHEFRTPVVVEVILEKVTNIAMGTEIDAINEFEDIECLHPEGREGLVAAGLLE